MYYKNLSSYLRETYGSAVFKICIDGGFTCPNRDGTKGYGGCAFCGERGSGEHIRPGSISAQIERYFRRKRKAPKVIAYFQNFTNTYAPTDVLRNRFDEALCDDRIVILDVGTRPDCIDEERADLLAEYKSKVDIWVELGLHTSSDKTAERINRCYPSSDFTTAVNLLTSRGIKPIAHMVIGLPGENFDDVRRTLDFINAHPVFGVKIHSLYVIEGTQLASDYKSGKYTPITLETYADYAAYVLKNLRQDIVVHKITGDAPKDLLIAPSWNTDKNAIMNAINDRLKRLGTK